MSYSSIAHSRLNPGFRRTRSATPSRSRAAALLRRWVERTQRRGYQASQRRHEAEDLTDRYIDRHGEFRIDEASFAAHWQR